MFFFSTDFNQTPKGLNLSIARGVATAEPLVRKDTSVRVLAAGMVVVPFLFRQNPILLIFAFIVMERNTCPENRDDADDTDLRWFFLFGIEP